LRVTLLIGGCVFDKVIQEGTKLMVEYANTILKAEENGHELAIVAGGGRLARKYIGIARSLEAPKSILDDIGILCTKLNAYLLISALGDKAYPYPPSNYRDYLSAFLSGKIVVCGGMSPGQSTDAVAALISEYLQSDLMVKMTSAEGVYDRHPKEAGAKLIPKITYSRARKIISQYSYDPGTYELIDPIALKILERSNIPCRIVHGKDPKNILKAIEGRNIGTLVYGESR